MQAQDQPPGSTSGLPWRRYLASCGLLLLPILAWNATFTRFLPPVFVAPPTARSMDLISMGEQLLRIGVLTLPFLMPLDLRSERQRPGLLLFALGACAYFASWLPLMLAPGSGWSTSPAGMLAPAVTPLFWLAGIALAGHSLFWRSPYRRWHYLALSVAFVACHLAGASLNGHS